MIRRPPRSTLDRSSAASDVYKRQEGDLAENTNSNPNFGISRAMLPEKAPLSTLIPGGGKERSFRCARFSVKSWIGEGISQPRSTRAIIWPPTVRSLPLVPGLGFEIEKFRYVQRAVDSLRSA